MELIKYKSKEEINDRAFFGSLPGDVLTICAEYMAYIPPCLYYDITWKFKALYCSRFYKNFFNRYGRIITRETLDRLTSVLSFGLTPLYYEAPGIARDFISSGFLYFEDLERVLEKSRRITEESDSDNE